MNFEILEINQNHENISDKDFTCAFILVYQNINILLANRYFKSEIDNSIIAEAICNILLSFNENEHNQKLHFLLSLVYKCKAKKNNNVITFVSIKSLYSFTQIEIVYIAIERINAVRKDDGFLTYIQNSTFKKYESIPNIIKEIYNSDQENFKSIILELGIIKNENKS